MPRSWSQKTKLLPFLRAAWSSLMEAAFTCSGCLYGPHEGAPYVADDECASTRRAVLPQKTDRKEEELDDASSACPLLFSFLDFYLFGFFCFCTRMIYFFLSCDRFRRPALA